MTALAVTVPLENLIQLINKGVEAGDPLAVAALAEWLTLSAGIAGMTHLLDHIDPDILVRAMQDAMDCSRGGSATNMH